MLRALRRNSRPAIRLGERRCGRALLPFASREAALAPGRTPAARAAQVEEPAEVAAPEADAGAKVPVTLDALIARRGGCGRRHDDGWRATGVERGAAPRSGSATGTLRLPRPLIQVEAATRSPFVQTLPPQAPELSEVSEPLRAPPLPASGCRGALRRPRRGDSDRWFLQDARRPSARARWSRRRRCRPPAGPDWAAPRWPRWWWWCCSRPGSPQADARQGRSDVGLRDDPCPGARAEGRPAGAAARHRSALAAQSRARCGGRRARPCWFRPRPGRAPGVRSPAAEAPPPAGRPHPRRPRRRAPDWRRCR